MKKLIPQQDTFFVSEIDRFQLTFDQEHAKSASQLAEIAKYQRIIQLRDSVVVKKEADDKVAQ